MKKLTGYFAALTACSALAVPLIAGASETPESMTFPSIPLNDTGIVWGGDYPSGGNSDCTGVEITAQDCSHGRDVTHNDDSNGHAGFDFTKLDANGNVMPASATTWSCVRDNVTGLIWEVKDDSGGLHDKDNTYTWYNTDSRNNGGAAGTANRGICHGGGDCDTSGFVATVNAIGLCGKNDWRLPKVEELRSIINLNINKPAIDSTYFPNTKSVFYWSSSLFAFHSKSARSVFFGNGDEFDNNKLYDNHVRLVRGAQ